MSPAAHAVTGRLPCLSVVPALVIFNVTPRARIARAGQGQPLAKRHRFAVDLHMRALVVLEKSDNELRAVGAAIVLERGLGERGR